MLVGLELNEMHTYIPLIIFHISVKRSRRQHFIEPALDQSGKLATKIEVLVKSKLAPLRRWLLET